MYLALPRVLESANETNQLGAFFEGFRPTDSQHLSSPRTRPPRPQIEGPTEADTLGGASIDIESDFGQGAIGRYTEATTLRNRRRCVTDEERGALIKRLVAWMQLEDIANPQRLALLHLAGSDRLIWQTGRLIALVATDELARQLHRCTSATRAVLSALQADGYIARPAAGVIDITPAAEAAGWRGADPSPAPEHAAENPAPRQKSSARSSSIEIESKKYNYINKLELCAETSGFPAAQYAAIIDGIRRPEVRAGLNHTSDIAALVDALPPGDPGEWTHSDIARAIMQVPAFASDADGRGVAPALVRASCARLGRLALTQALAALLMGRAPKGLYVHMARTAGDPDVTAWQVARAVHAAAARVPAHLPHQVTAAPEVATSTPRSTPRPRPARTKTILQQRWDEAGGPPPLAGEFQRLAVRTLPHILPPLRQS